MGIDYYQPKPDPESGLEGYYVVVPFPTKIVVFRTSSRKPEDLAWKSTSLDRKVLLLSLAFLFVHRYKAYVL